MSKSNVLTRAKKRHAYACVQANRIDEALALYQKICETDPKDAESWFMVGTLYGRLGRLPEAEAALRKAVALQPKFAQGYIALGQALELQGKFAEAEGQYTHAVSLKPDAAEAYDALGRLCQLRGDMQAAVGYHQKAIELNSSMPVAYLSLARAQHQLGALDAAVDNIEQALRLNAHQAEAYYDLAGVRVSQGRYDDALYCIRQAQLLRPAYVEAQAVEAFILDHQQQYQQAVDCITPLLERYRQFPVIALVYAKLSHHTKDYEGAIQRLESLLGDPGLTEDLKLKIHFHLGELNDKRADYAKAYAHFEAGNKLKHVNFDRRAWEQKITETMAIFNRDALARASRASNCSERPIFIVGMPRSGTSLVEQMLSMLPDVSAAGELGDISALATEMEAMLADTSPANNITQLSREQCDGLAQRYLNMLDGKYPNAKRVTDKMPHNFLHLGVIALLFPMARVIHCIRDPFDTCLSCYFQEFTGDHPYAYDFGNLGFYYRQYRRLMEHWRKVLDIGLFEINYEDLVRDPETYGRAMVEFCGLKWDKRCLEFYKGEHRAATASFQQVRRPIYTGSLGRWQHYAAFLDPLKQALGETSPRL